MILATIFKASSMRRKGIWFIYEKRFDVVWLWAPGHKEFWLKTQTGDNLKKE